MVGSQSFCDDDMKRQNFCLANCVLCIKLSISKRETNEDNSMRVHIQFGDNISCCTTHSYLHAQEMSFSFTSAVCYCIIHLTYATLFIMKTLIVVARTNGTNTCIYSQHILIKKPIIQPYALFGHP